MRILQVCPTYYPINSGVPEHVKNISERLAKHHELIVYATDSSGLLPKEEIINNVNIKRFSSWAPDDSYFLSFSLEQYLRQHFQEFDLIHAHGYHSLPALHAARAKGKTRLIFTSHYHGSGHTFGRSILHLAYKALVKQLIDKSEKIIAVSEFEKNLLSKNFSISTGKQLLIPNGLNLSDFRVTSGLKETETKTILFVGRLEKYKGIHYIIEAMPRIPSDVTLEIVGDGPYKKTLRNLIQKLGVDHRVVFYATLTKEALLQKYSKADLLVLLSCFEAYSMVVAEALASGTRCLVANKQALSEWIDNRSCFGIDFPINSEALSKKISSILNSPSPRPIKPNKRILDWDEVVDMLENQAYCAKPVSTSVVTA